MNVDVPRLLAALGIEHERRRGDLWAACPFEDHEEKTPSWHIVDAAAGEKNGSHFCFGCERGGGPIDLVMLAIGITFGGARRWIEDRGLDKPAPPTLQAELVVESTRWRAFKLPLERRHEGTFGHWVSPPRRYVLGRGIDVEQAERWRLSYCIEGRLAGRVVLPFHSEDGRPESYSARAFDGRKPKYLTPRENENPVPGAMFGPLQWPEPDSRATVVVCEGAINAMACERAGAEAVAALNGSALHPVHVARLATFERIVVASDNDHAGNKLAAELMGALARWRKVRRAIIPVGEDAATMPVARLARTLDAKTHSDR